MVRGFDLAFESDRVSIPAMGSYCLATLMSSDRTKQNCLWITIYIGILGSVKPELGVIPSGQEIIHE